jgi:hypothetical protein
VINDFANNGVVIAGAYGVTFAGNVVGLDPTGTQRRGNGWSGLLLYDGANGCTIGGLSPAERNVIAGNWGAGVTLGNSGTTGNTVAGNYLGAAADGSRTIANQTGVTISSASGNVIGGSAAAARNVISGNNEAGVAIGNLSSGNTVAGNLIGTGPDGTTPLGNTGPGVWVYDGYSGPATGNSIGDRAVGAGNVIAFNRVGFRVTNRFAVPCTGNTIVGNSIHSNAELGIDLAGDGPTANDPLDADAGANGLQNFPVVTSAARGGGLLVAGTLAGAPSQAFTVDVYAGVSCDGSGFGEGARYLGALQTTTDASGQATFAAVLAATARFGEAVTATDTAGNTSELSACHPVGARLRRSIPRQID